MRSVSLFEANRTKNEVEAACNPSALRGKSAAAQRQPPGGSLQPSLSRTSEAHARRSPCAVPEEGLHIFGNLSEVALFRVGDFGEERRRTEGLDLTGPWRDQARRRCLLRLKEEAGVSAWAECFQGSSILAGIPTPFPTSSVAIFFFYFFVV